MGQRRASTVSPRPPALSKIQIDVVGLRADRWIDIGKCKWGTVASLPALAAELEEKVHPYPNTRGAEYIIRRHERRDNVA
jgi:hypothetical protein